MLRFRFWKDRAYNLSRMSMDDLVEEFVTYPPVDAYATDNSAAA
jgi:hypothetical protein